MKVEEELKYLRDEALRLSDFGARSRLRLRVGGASRGIQQSALDSHGRR
jgi:hypothetical protein